MSWTIIVLSAATLMISVMAQDTLYNVALAATLGLAMSVIIITDARYFIIPDIISLPMIVLGIVLSPLFPHNSTSMNAILYSVLAASLGFLVFYVTRLLYKVIRQKEGLGFGDVKLAAVAGAWTGMEGLNIVFLLSCLSALGFILILHLSGNRVKASTALPFGVFIAPSIWVVWILQSIHF